MTVDKWEERLEELLHQLISVELRPHQEETDISKEFPHRAGSLISHVSVCLLQDDISVILCLSHQDLKRVCG